MSYGTMRKITFGLLLLAVIVAVFILTYNDTAAIKASVIDAAQDHLMTIAETEAKHIEDAFGHIQESLRTLAKDKEIIGLVAHDVRIEDGAKSSGRHSEETLVESLKVVGVYLDAYYRLNAKGTVQNRIPFASDRIGADFSSKPGVKHVIENHEPYVSNVFRSFDGYPCISVCQPVFSDQRFIGIVRVMVLSETIRDLAGHIKVGQRGYARVIDHAGKVLAHPAADQIGEDMMAIRKKAFPDADWSSLDEVVVRMTRGEAGTSTYRSE